MTTTFATRPATQVISSDPAQALAETVVRSAFEVQHGRLADSNDEVDLLRLIAISVGKHREYGEQPQKGREPKAPAFLRLAERLQRGL